MRCFVGFKEEEGCHEFEATRDAMRESKKSGVCKQAAAKELRRKERSGVGACDQTPKSEVLQVKETSNRHN